MSRLKNPLRTINVIIQVVMNRTTIGTTLSQKEKKIDKDIGTARRNLLKKRSRSKSSAKEK